jgi:hypothetical protein
VFHNVVPINNFYIVFLHEEDESKHLVFLSMFLSALESFAICAHRIPLAGESTLLVEGQHILVGLAATRAWAVELPFQISARE